MPLSRLPWKKSRQHPPPEAKTLDHLIAQHGGSTAAIDTLPLRIQKTKYESIDTRQRLEQLTRENGYLRQELAHLKDTHESFLTFYHTIIETVQTMEVAIRDVSEKIALSEQRLTEYWGFDITDLEPQCVEFI